MRQKTKVKTSKGTIEEKKTLTSKRMKPWIEFVKK